MQQSAANDSTVSTGRKNAKRPIYYNGKEYPSRKSLTDSFGISYYTFMQRLQRGWSIEKAVNYKGGRIYFTKEELDVIYFVVCSSMGSLFSCVSNNAKIMEGIKQKLDVRGFYGSIHGDTDEG